LGTALGTTQVRSLTALLPTLRNLKSLSLSRCKPAFKKPSDLRRVLVSMRPPSPAQVYNPPPI
jgi:hypothetical protein